MMRFNGLLALFIGKDFSFRIAAMPLGLMLALGLASGGCSFSDDDDDDDDVVDDDDDDDDTTTCTDPTPEECKGDCYAACPSGETRNPSTCECEPGPTQCPGSIELSLDDGAARQIANAVVAGAVSFGSTVTATVTADEHEDNLDCVFSLNGDAEDMVTNGLEGTFEATRRGPATVGVECACGDNDYSDEIETRVVVTECTAEFELSGAEDIPDIIPTPDGGVPPFEFSFNAQGSSTDPNIPGNDIPASRHYAWTLTGPDGTVLDTLEGISNSANFNATRSWQPGGLTQLGTYDLELCAGVANLDGETVLDVVECGCQNFPINVGTIPLCAELTSVLVEGSDPVALDACVTNDPDGSALSFAWSCEGPAGDCTGSLSALDVCDPQFTPPSSGEFVLVMTATDPDENTCLHQTTVEVNTPPVLVFDLQGVEDNRLPFRTNCNGFLATCAGSNDHADGSPVTCVFNYSTPSGTQTAHGTEASFIACEKGDYSVETCVTDNVGATVCGTEDFTVGDGFNRTPVARVRVTGLDYDFTNLDATGTGGILTLLLDGSDSFDWDGQNLTYDWTVTRNGNPVTLADQALSWVHPVAAGPATYEISLVVSDGTATSAPATATYVVEGANCIPTVDAGPDQILLLNPESGTVDVLVNGESTDCNNDSVGYAWSLTVPSGSAAMDSAAGLDQSALSFIADVPGPYVACLTASDAVGSSAEDCATIIVNDEGVDGNQCPEAVIGVKVGTEYLTAPVVQFPTANFVGSFCEIEMTSFSTDPDGDIEANGGIYRWGKVFSNPEPTTLSPLDKKNTKLKIDNVDCSDDPSLHIVKMRVEEATEDAKFRGFRCERQQAVTVINVITAIPPVLVPAVQPCVVVPGEVALDATAMDLDTCLVEGPSACYDKMATFQWQLLSAPSGSGAVIDNPTFKRPNVIGIDKEGKYTLKLTVSDPDGAKGFTLASFNAVAPGIPGTCGSFLGTGDNLDIMVTDRDGNPIEGATVYVGNTVLPDLTDANGQASTTVSSFPVNVSAEMAGYQSRTFANVNVNSAVLPLTKAVASKKTVKGRLSDASWNLLPKVPADIIDIGSMIDCLLNGAAPPSPYDTSPCAVAAFQIKIGIAIPLLENRKPGDVDFSELLADAFKAEAVPLDGLLNYLIPGNMMTDRPILTGLGILEGLLPLLGVNIYFDDDEDPLFTGDDKHMKEFLVQVPSNQPTAKIGALLGYFDLSPDVLNALISALAGGGGLDFSVILGQISFNAYYMGVGEFNVGGNNLGTVDISQFSNIGTAGVPEVGNHLFVEYPHTVNNPDRTVPVITDPPLLAVLDILALAGPGLPLPFEILPLPLISYLHRFVDITPGLTAALNSRELPPTSVKDQRVIGQVPSTVDISVLGQQNCNECVISGPTQYGSNFDHCVYRNQAFKVAPKRSAPAMSQVAAVGVEFGPSVPWAEGMIMPAGFSFHPDGGTVSIPEIGEGALSDARFISLAYGARGLSATFVNDLPANPPAFFSLPGELATSKPVVGGATLRNYMEFPLADDSGIVIDSGARLRFDDKTTQPDLVAGCFLPNNLSPLAGLPPDLGWAAVDFTAWASPGVAPAGFPTYANWLFFNPGPFDPVPVSGWGSTDLLSVSCAGASTLTADILTSSSRVNGLIVGAGTGGRVGGRANAYLLKMDYTDNGQPDALDGCQSDGDDVDVSLILPLFTSDRTVFEMAAIPYTGAYAVNTLFATEQGLYGNRGMDITNLGIRPERFIAGSIPSAVQDLAIAYVGGAWQALTAGPDGLFLLDADGFFASGNTIVGGDIISNGGGSGYSVVGLSSNGDVFASTGNNTVDYWTGPNPDLSNPPDGSVALAGGITDIDGNLFEMAAGGGSGHVWVASGSSLYTVDGSGSETFQGSGPNMNFIDPGEYPGIGSGNEVVLAGGPSGAFLFDPTGVTGNGVGFTSLNNRNNPPNSMDQDFEVSPMNRELALNDQNAKNPMRIPSLASFQFDSLKTDSLRELAPGTNYSVLVDINADLVELQLQTASRTPLWEVIVNKKAGNTATVQLPQALLEKHFSQGQTIRLVAKALRMSGTGFTYDGFDARRLYDVLEVERQSNDTFLYKRK